MGALREAEDVRLVEFLELSSSAARQAAPSDTPPV